MMNFIRLLLVVFVLMLISACTNTKTVFQKEQDEVDPSLAYTQLPLTYPPVYGIYNPVEHVDTRIMVSKMPESASAIILGNSANDVNTRDNNLSVQDSEYLRKIQVAKADENIREKVDAETLILLRTTNINPDLPDPASIYKTLNTKKQ